MNGKTFGKLLHATTSEADIVLRDPIIPLEKSKTVSRSVIFDSLQFHGL